MFFVSGVSMENASLWTVSPIAVSARRAIVERSVTSRVSCSTPANICPASTAAVSSQTVGTPTATVRAASPGSCVTQVSPGSGLWGL